MLQILQLFYVFLLHFKQRRNLSRKYCYIEFFIRFLKTVSHDVLIITKKREIL